MIRYFAFPRAFTAIIGMFISLSACTFKDPIARHEVETLRGNVQSVESSLKVRQMGIGEQLQQIREALAHLRGTADENRRAAKLVNRRVEVLKIENQENLAHLKQLQQERFQHIDENINRLARRLENLQKSIQTLSSNLAEMAEFEKRQEEKISKIQGQFQNQLQVVVEEIGRENQRLQSNINANQEDIIDFQKLLNRTNTRLQELARKQEALRKAVTASRGRGQHVVRKGETLSSIASRYGASLEEIMEKNNLTDPNLIREGQKLIIPGQ